MSGFFGFGQFRTGTVLGNLLAKGGQFGPNFRAAGGGTPTVFTMGGPNSSGPWNPPGIGWPFGQSNDFGAFSNTGATTGGPTYGVLASGSGLINGQTIEAAGFDGDPGTGAFVLVLGPTGTLTQNFFTTLTVGAPLNYVLTTATASYFNSNDPVAGFANFTVWAWAKVPVAVFGSNISLTAT